ncbi:thioredoxin domain-containing protein [Aerophototrophica crusticola]|uniref:Thioredoxin domain-containing protein n=1 Tax=Aerophototrophica crusticola TaxID=1709002 RepID=A0A858RB61_9PROT|nr:thioredoxin domain-containing protein [Rhodospirillaceae bacterium B3]
MAEGANLLGRETSPYLLQHADNPVHWMAWGPEAFARAKAEDKPILLSVGYAACHWCHVMAHESFEDPEIARLMNELFVNVKVDREERPDLDQVYQQALSLLGQQGGWPLTMFLTPGGEPFWGGTYFPPATRWGRPGFPDVLRGVANTYRTEPEKVTRNVSALKDALTKLSQNRPGGSVEPAVLDQVAERLVREVDPFNGGIGDAPKFPQPSIFTLLWQAFKRTGKPPYASAVINTLTRMSQGGIYDHLGGGFARYSTDAQWLAPHFEKMLYDNAQLLELLTAVWQETRDPLFEARIRETAAWVLREMVAEAGGFAATLDADSEGEEGRFYVWSKAEVDTVLGADADAFCAVYDISHHGNWEETNIPNRLKDTSWLGAERETALAAQRARLLAVRDKRVRPGWDDKVLADWNGLMIAGLAKAGAALGEQAWIDAAARAFGFVASSMQEHGRLKHSWRHGQLKHASTLEDHANMARAALALFEVIGDWSLVEQARAWVAVLDKHYWDGEGGGYFIVADDATDLIVRPRHAHDNAVPAGNGTMVGVLARLWLLTGEEAYRQRADALVDAFSGELTRNFFPLATWLNGIELLETAVQVVVAGEPGAADTRALLAAVHGLSLPTLVLTPLAPGMALPEGHPAAGKGLVDGKAAAYVCRYGSCGLPVTDPAELTKALGG